MGLDIWIEKQCVYDHSYSCLHNLRLWICKKFNIPLDSDDIQSWITNEPFPHLLTHADNEGIYVLDSEQEPKLYVGSLPKLKTELETIMQYRKEMPEHIGKTFEDLYSATVISLKKGKNMEFS